MEISSCLSPPQHVPCCSKLIQRQQSDISVINFTCIRLRNFTAVIEEVFICHHFPPFSLLWCKEQVLLSLSRASDQCRNSRSNYGLCSSFPVASTLLTLLGWLLLSRADLTLRQPHSGQKCEEGCQRHDQDVPEHCSLQKEKMACFALLKRQVNKEQTGQEDCVLYGQFLSTILAN